MGQRENAFIAKMRCYENALLLRKELTLQHRLVYPNIGYAIISVKQHSDKKPLVGYDKDSERVHRWLPIEFINEK